MKLVDMAPGWSAYTQLASTALAVVVRRVDGWCVYVAGVRGYNHDFEAAEVQAHGDKLDEATARAVIANRFHPGIDPDGLDYIT